MMFDINTYLQHEKWNKILRLSETKSSPFLVVDLDCIQSNYMDMVGLFPRFNIYYAMKANPAHEVINLLKKMGSYFDCASTYELDKVLESGVHPDKISYGNTIKKIEDIAYAHSKGVRLYVTDSDADIENIAKFAPNAKVFVRILVDGGDTAEWPLSRKFGCHPTMAVHLLIKAKKLGLVPYGVSFHVGSQQQNISSWNEALVKVQAIFKQLQEKNITLNMINLGGGFPARYKKYINPLQDYANSINRYIDEYFPNCEDLELVLEPGRSLVGNSGVLVSEIVLISHKSLSDKARWVFTDVGLFQGLFETLGEAIKYPIYTTAMASSKQCESVILAGPTCDSADIMYEETMYQLPVENKIGDKLYWLTTGAYTYSYSSVEFNGFPPLKVHYLE